jgi:hypothetical protein
MHGCSTARTNWPLGSRGMETEPVHIEQTDTAFTIGWKGRYRIDGPAFVYSGPGERSGRHHPRVPDRQHRGHRLIGKFEILSG